MSPEKHQMRVAEILAVAPKQHRKWLKWRMEYGNEPSLADRLRQLIDELSPALDAQIPDRDAFVDQVVTTRNYLTHYDKSKEDEAAKGADLYYLARRVRVLLDACLLREIGFDVAAITRLLTRSTRYHDETVSI